MLFVSSNGGVVLSSDEQEKMDVGTEIKCENEWYEKWRVREMSRISAAEVD
jgi:hypothetical protein